LNLLPGHLYIKNQLGTASSRLLAPPCNTEVVFLVMLLLETVFLEILGTTSSRLLAPPCNKEVVFLVMLLLEAVFLDILGTASSPGSSHPPATKRWCF
jgi:hypothetical protein